MAEHKHRLRYDNAGGADFSTVLRNRVDAYMNRHGGRKADWYQWVRVGGIFAAYLACWSALALAPHSFAVTLGLLALHAAISFAVVCMVVHEAGHHALSGNRKIDDAITWISFHLLGPNARLFQLRHNDVHHMFTNIPTLDTDIEASTIIRFVPHVPWKPIHRYQHIYAPILYSLFTFVWIFFKDFKVINMTEIGNLKNIKHTRAEKIEFYALKAFYVGYMIGVPALVLPYSLGQVLLGFAIYHVILANLVTMLIGALHVFETTQFVKFNEKGELPYSWLEHSLYTTASVRPENPAIIWVLSAFAAHIEHHMFPTVSSRHFPAISKITRETAREFGLPYHRFTFSGLFWSHLKMLKHMGTGPDAGKHLVVEKPVVETAAGEAHASLRLRPRQTGRKSARGIA